MSKLRSVARPLDPVVAARTQGKVGKEPAGKKSEGLHDHDHDARGPPQDLFGARWLTLAKTARHLGLSTMTISRYATEEHYSYLEFPKPSVIVDRCYWDVDDVDQWMRSRVGATSSRRKPRSAAGLTSPFTQIDNR